MNPSDLPPVIGWIPLWSKDRRTLVQVFTDIETGLIQRVTVTNRRTVESWWGPTIEVNENWSDVPYA